jgi:hypothetical protein
VAKRQTNPKTPLQDEQLQVTFNVPIEMPSVYATNIVLQQMEHEVLVSFYEIQPPLLLGGANEAENLAILKKTGMRADCVAKVIIAKQRFGAFADVMKQLATTIRAAEKKEKDA